MSAPGPRGLTVLVCDDAAGIRKTLAQILGDEGYRVETFEDGGAVLSRLGEPKLPKPAALFLDVWLPDVDGLSVLDQLRARGHDLPVVMISGHGTVETAVQAVKRGADDFLEKPLALERVLLTLEKALERSRLARERDVLAREVARQRERLEEEETLLGEGPAMTRLREELRRAGASDARVLITGESGVGKEVAARTLHRLSPRAGGPFVDVNGAAIPEDLIESELFGHVKGSFTGATEDRKGKWEAADGGTLFLDEIGDMSPRTQAKILRAIQDGKISRVGATRTIETDVRIVAATNRDLNAMVAAGTFREDLYYRLAVFPIAVPPLRERREDVPLLAAHFLSLAGRELNTPARSLSPGARARLSAYGYPGNVRELRNLIERATILARGPVIEAEDLPLGPAPEPEAAEEALFRGLPESVELGPMLHLIERRLVQRALASAHGVQAEAARRLGISRSLLAYKLKALGIAPEPPSSEADVKET
ncbi:MAG TPA: sigma-54 dependent transcriptional regulator [Thermoanaerobaculia bacterium]|nr:sigma-54 dependent transcriptional regulator [Thermoanaerobaculia bacterium]